MAEANAAAAAVKQIMEEHGHNADVVFQVYEMVGNAVDFALKHLTRNGGARPQPLKGYQHPARTAEEIRNTPAAND